MRSIGVRFAVLAMLAAGFPVLAVQSASAAPSAVRASTGAACTIVGTPGPDRLTGTAGRDVICGRGGNDVIDARGGGDVVDGGPGRDLIRGGKGGDTLVGGSGADTLFGGRGVDKLRGGTGTDKLRGGTAGDDLRGGTGNDSLAGESGHDLADGDEGTDAVVGDSGNDLLRGGGGTDRLRGGTGDDVLSGGSGADAQNGDSGDNTCAFDVADTSRIACVYDTLGPVVTDLRLSATQVDVSLGSKSFGYTVRVIDDTGVDYVWGSVRNDSGGNSDPNGQVPATLISGTRLDGVWAGTITVPRWVAPGAWTGVVSAQDRLGRYGNDEFPNLLTVRNTNVDVSDPVLRSWSAAPSGGTFPIDVTSTDGSLLVTARFTDAGTGVNAGLACFAPPVGDTTSSPQGRCGYFSLVNGTSRDGTYTATVPMRRGSPPGAWGLSVYANDGAGRGGGWYTSQYYDALEAQAGGTPFGFRLPGGPSAIPVANANPPALTQVAFVTLSPATVDTSTGPATVSVSVRLTDTNPGGINSVQANLASGLDADGSVNFNGGFANAPTSGTRNDGVWHFDLTMPQGTPPAQYPVYIGTTDEHSDVNFLTGPTLLTYPNTTLLPSQVLTGGVGSFTVIDAD